MVNFSSYWPFFSIHFNLASKIVSPLYIQNLFEAEKPWRKFCLPKSTFFWNVEKLTPCTQFVLTKPGHLTKFPLNHGNFKKSSIASHSRVMEGKLSFSHHPPASILAWLWWKNNCSGQVRAAWEAGSALGERHALSCQSWVLPALPGLQGNRVGNHPSQGLASHHQGMSRRFKLRGDFALSILSL